MSRIRLNQEYRNKVAVKMKSYAEQEDTHKKKKNFSKRGKILKQSKIKLGNLLNNV